MDSAGGKVPSAEGDVLTEDVATKKMARFKSDSGKEVLIRLPNVLE